MIQCPRDSGEVEGLAQAKRLVTELSCSSLPLLPREEKRPPNTRVMTKVATFNMVWYGMDVRMYGCMDDMMYGGMV